METKKVLNKEVYEAPILKVVEVKVEQGFQMSVKPSSHDPLKEIK